MKHTKTRLLSLVLAIGMIVSLFPSTALAAVEATDVAKIGDNGYPTLAAAVAAAQSGDTITLLANASGAGVFVDPDQSFTLDLGTHTYTTTGPAVGSEGTESQAFHIEEGGSVTIKNGTITSTSDSGVLMLVQNYKDLTLDKVTLDGSNLPGAKPYTLSNNCGTVVINDTTIIAKAGGVAFDSCEFSTYEIPNVTVSGDSVITGPIEMSGGSLTVTGGSFTDLATAVKYATTGATIKLAADATGDGIIIDKDITIDLNTHTYTVNGQLAGSTNTKNQGFQLLAGNDVTIQNGTLTTGTNCTGNITDGKAKMLIQNYSNLILENVQLVGTNLEEGSIVLSNNCGNTEVGTGLNVSGDTSITAPIDGRAMDVSWWTGDYPDGAQVSIDTEGKIKGDIELGFYNAPGETVGSSLTINNVDLQGSIVVAEEDSRFPTGLTDEGKATLALGMCTVNGGTFSDMSWLPYAANNASVKLGADVTSPDTAVCYHIDGKAITLDLNGHELSGLANGSCPVATHFIRIENGGQLTVADTSAAKTGVISSTYKANSDLKVIEVMANSALVLNGGTITNGNDVNFACTAVYIRSDARFEMNGGTVAAANNPNLNPQKREYAMWMGDDTSAAVINGGTITTDSADYITAKSGLVINGGKFINATVLQYLAEDGTYELAGAGKISSDTVIPAGATLNVNDGASLTISSGKILTISEGATVINNGTITNAGEIVNNGTFTDNGTFLGTPVGGEVAGVATVIEDVAAVATKEEATASEVAAAVEAVTAIDNTKLADAETLDTLAALEDKLVAANENIGETQIVKTSVPNKVLDVAVDNAALSVPTDVETQTAAKVTVAVADAPTETGKTPADIVADVLGEDAVADEPVIIPIAIDLKIGDSAESIQPKAPLVVKFKVDMEAVDAAKLVIVHYKHDNSTEVIRPTVITEDSGVYIQFTTISLSTFVLISTADTLNTNAYEVIFTPDKLNASAGQEVTYTVGIKQNAGVDAIANMNLGLSYNSTILTNPVFTKNTELSSQAFDFGATVEEAGFGESTRPAGTYTLDLNSQGGWIVNGRGEVEIGTLKFTVGDAGTGFTSQGDFQVDILSSINNASYLDPAALSVTTTDSLSYQYVTVKLGSTTFLVPYGTKALYDDMTTLMNNAPGFTTGTSAVPPVVATSASYRLTDTENWYLADKTTTYGSFTGFTSSKVFYAKQAYLRTVTLVDSNNKFIVGSGFDGNAEAGFKIANDQDAVFMLGDTPTNYRLDSVTYKVGSADAVTLTAVEGNYTIPMTAITGNTTITITYAINLTAENIGVFVDGSGTPKAFSAYSGSKTLVLINAGDIAGFTMANGSTVYATNGYAGYTHVVLFDKTGLDTADAVKASILSNIAPGAANETLAYDYNTNGKPGPLATDVQVVYDFSSLRTLKWTPTDKLLLLADVLTFNGENTVNTRASYTVARDGVLTVEDINAFLYAYAQFRPVAAN